MVKQLPHSDTAVRKLHVGHFAFMRAYIQGLDLREIWDRYLAVEGTRSDLRVIRRTVAWLRDALAAAAHRHGRHSVAHLVRIDLSTIIEPDEPVAPPFDDFVAQHGWDGFSYEEQIEAYTAAYGQASAQEKRSVRLLRRQLEALTWLERLAAESPHADDGVRAWMRPELAARLEAAGMPTLRHLAERINGVGLRWYTPVAAIGAGKAAHIVSLMRSFAPSTGLAIGPHVLAAPSRLTPAERRLVLVPATALVPLDKFVVPSALDGSNGQYRAPRSQCQLRANTDYEALLAFLREKQLRHAPGQGLRHDDHPLAWLQHLAPTARAYRTECERFMLWAILKCQKPMSSMTFEDACAYRAFLADPDPAWCGPRSRARWGPAWRPFEGPLSEAAGRRALTMLATFYKFLVDQRYLTGTPWTGVTKPPPPPRMAGPGRSLTQDQWRFVCDQLAALPPTSANLRLNVALQLLYAGRLRRAELIAARCGDLEVLRLPATPDEPAVEGWVLNVRGKGGKERQVPLGQQHIALLTDYLYARGATGPVNHPRNAHIFLLGQVTDAVNRRPGAENALGMVDTDAGISAQTLYGQVTGFFAYCGQLLAAGDPDGAARLHQASTHWMRHTGITHSLAAGTPIDVEMLAAGHASMATTSRYTHSEPRRLLQGSRAFLDR